VLTSDDRNNIIELEQMFVRGVARLAGAFQTSREIFSNSIWRNIVEFRLFFLIYGHAAFVDGVKLYGMTLKRGQWVRSYRNLQEDLEYIENRAVKRYSLSVIKRAVDNLVHDERLKIEGCELGTLFEVVNYDKYQDLDNYKIGNENGVGTALERSENNNKNVKNVKNIYISAQHLSMTKDEYEKLVDLYGKSAVDSKIEYARNYKKLKNYVSLYKTLNNWLKADKEKSQDGYRRSD
jgi:hypothetical protein